MRRRWAWSPARRRPIRLSDNAVIGTAAGLTGASAVNALSKAAVGNALVSGRPLVGDPAASLGATGGSSVVDKAIPDTPTPPPSPTVCPSPPHTESMTTRATRSPRRRTVVALAVVLVVLSAFVVRLVDIQVVNAREHVDDSEQFATGAKTTLYGARGDIVDDNGVVLASSTTLYDVQIDPMLAAQGAVQTDASGNAMTDADGKDIMTPWTDVAPRSPRSRASRPPTSRRSCPTRWPRTRRRASRM
jgi:hypothetical protein